MEAFNFVGNIEWASTNKCNWSHVGLRLFDWITVLNYMELHASKMQLDLTTIEDQLTTLTYNGKM